LNLAANLLFWSARDTLRTHGNLITAQKATALLDPTVTLCRVLRKFVPLRPISGRALATAHASRTFELRIRNLERFLYFPRHRTKQLNTHSCTDLRILSQKMMFARICAHVFNTQSKPTQRLATSVADSNTLQKSKTTERHTIFVRTHIHRAP
jgi:isocitrate/isopropylmalate dehydrogenase